MGNFMNTKDSPVATTHCYIGFTFQESFEGPDGGLGNDYTGRGPFYLFSSSSPRARVLFLRHSYGTF
jgi:hypothetical protein